MPPVEKQIGERIFPAKEFLSIRQKTSCCPKNSPLTHFGLPQIGELTVLRCSGCCGIQELLCPVDLAALHSNKQAEAHCVRR